MLENVQKIHNFSLLLLQLFPSQPTTKKSENVMKRRRKFFAILMEIVITSSSSSSSNASVPSIHDITETVSHIHILKWWFGIFLACEMENNRRFFASLLLFCEWDEYEWCWTPATLCRLWCCFFNLLPCNLREYFQAF